MIEMAVQHVGKIWKGECGNYSNMRILHVTRLQSTRLKLPPFGATLVGLQPNVFQL